MSGGMKRRSVIAGASLTLMLTGAALAADPAAPPPDAPPESGWTFTVAPYFWMAGMKGTIGQFGAPSVDVDASFSDIIKNFDIGGMAVAEAHNGRFGVAFDFQYTKLSADGKTRFGAVADRIEVTSETLTALIAGEYRVVDTGTANVDLMAGARIWSVDTDIDPRGGPGDPLYFSDGDSWVDPIVGVRGRVNMSERAYLTGWGMIGGFGAASDITWDVMAAIGYEVSDRVAIIGGYRALSVDYSNDDFLFDVVQHGPILGARIAF